MKKPGIPPTPKQGESRVKFDATVKESLEILMGRRSGAIKLLDPATATTADCAAKINEILGRLQ